MEVLFFVLGAVFASFILVISTRLPKNEDVVFSRSKCDSCHHKLAWWQLIPIISYLLLRGKCHYCHKKISPLNIICEFTLGSLFLIGYVIYDFSFNLYIYLIISMLMLSIFITDFKEYIILDEPLLVSGILIVILEIVFLGTKKVAIYLASGVGLFLTMYLVKLVGDKIFKRESLGGGDIKLSFIIGLTLGYRLGLCALILSAFLALPYSIASLNFKKNNEVAFGPFLAASLFIVFLFADKFLGLLSLI